MSLQASRTLSKHLSLSPRSRPSRDCRHLLLVMMNSVCVTLCLAFLYELLFRPPTLTQQTKHHTSPYLALLNPSGLAGGCRSPLHRVTPPHRPYPFLQPVTRRSGSPRGACASSYGALHVTTAFLPNQMERPTPALCHGEHSHGHLPGGLS